jgi:hypothetical protein
LHYTSESYQNGGFFDKVEGNLSNGVETAIRLFLGGDFVKRFSTKSGAASGCGNNWAAAGYGLAAVGVIAFAAFGFGGEGRLQQMESSSPQRAQI